MTIGRCRARWLRTASGICCDANAVRARSSHECIGQARVLAHGMRGRESTMLEATPSKMAVLDVNRALGGCIQEALSQLSTPAVSAKNVHDARRAIKRARAMLRLQRSALGGKTYERENRALRDIARSLSAARDGKVQLDVLNHLIVRYPSKIDATSMQALRKIFSSRYRVSGKLSQESLRTSRTSLLAVSDRASKRSVEAQGWDTVGVGLIRIYRAGRRCAKRIGQPASAEDLHRWRKHVTYLWRSLEFLRPVWPQRAGKLARKAHRLAHHLGEDHDLHVLSAAIAEMDSAQLGQDDRSMLRHLIARRRRRLQRKAVELSKRVYRHSPSTLQAKLERRWTQWWHTAGSRGACPV